MIYSWVEIETVLACGQVKHNVLDWMIRKWASQWRHLETLDQHIRQMCSLHFYLIYSIQLIYSKHYYGNNKKCPSFCYELLFVKLRYFKFHISYIPYSSSAPDIVIIQNEQIIRSLRYLFKQSYIFILMYV